MCDGSKLIKKEREIVEVLKDWKSLSSLGLVGRSCFCRILTSRQNTIATIYVVSHLLKSLINSESIFLNKYKMNLIHFQVARNFPQFHVGGARSFGL